MNGKAKIKILMLNLLFYFTFFISVIAQEKSELFSLTLEELMNVKVVTASKSEQMLKETPAMTYLITEEMIKEHGYLDLMDVLNSLPYFQIQSEHGHWTKGGIVNLRGNRSGDSGNNKVLLLKDGIKLSDDAEEGLYMGLNSIPVNSIKQIEVVYGPNSTLYGRDAYAGMINLITKQDSTKYIGYSYGSFNSERVYGGVVHHFNKNVSANIYLYSYTSDEQDPTGISQTYLNRVAFPTKPYTEIFYRASKNRMVDLGFSFYGFSLRYLLYDIQGSETYGTNPNLYATEYSTLLGLENQIINAKYKYSFTDNLSLGINYSYKINEFNPMTANLYIDDLNRNIIYNPSDSSINVDPFYAYGGRKYYYFRTISHKVEAETQWKINTELKNVSGVSFDAVKGIPVISEGKGGNPFTTETQKEKYEHQFTTLGVFSEFTYRTPLKVLLTLGGRIDFNSLYGTSFMPRFAAIYEAGTNVFKLIYSSGFLAPSISQVYFESKTTFSWIKQNEDLKPETISSVEFVWNYIKDNFRISTNVFYNNLSNIIQESVETGDSVMIEINNFEYYVPILQSQNLDNGERYGCNLNISREINRYIKASLNYSLLLGHNHSSGNKIDIKDNLVPNHKFNLGFTFRFNNLSLYTEAIWSSASKILSNHNLTEYNSFLDDKGYINFGDKLLVNMNFRINDLYKSISLYCRIKNLLNTEYYGQTINARWGSPMVLQDLRRIDLGVELKFD